MSIIHKALFDQVQLVLQIKLEEFKLQQYNEITIEEIWNYCLRKKWKKRLVQDIPLHEVVSTILALQPSEIISHAHIHELQNSSLNIGLDLEELNILLKPLKSE